MRFLHLRASPRDLFGGKHGRTMAVHHVARLAVATHDDAETKVFRPLPLQPGQEVIPGPCALAVYGEGQLWSCPVGYTSQCFELSYVRMYVRTSVHRTRLVLRAPELRVPTRLTARNVRLSFLLYMLQRL